MKQERKQSLRKERGERRRKKQLVGQQTRRKIGDEKRKWRSITVKLKLWYPSGSIGG